MPKQKKLPTETQLRKARRKAMVERLFEAWKNPCIDPDFTVHVYDVKQRCPYTCVTVQVTEEIGRGASSLSFSSLGFSKCKWPDLFDALYGIDMAVRKAITYIVKESGIADG